MITRAGQRFAFAGGSILWIVVHLILCIVSAVTVPDIFTDSAPITVLGHWRLSGLANVHPNTVETETLF